MKSSGTRHRQSPRRPPGSKVSILDVVTGEFEVTRGHPLPLGAVSVRGGINFSIFSKDAAGVTLVLFAPRQEEPLAEFPLDPRYNKTGDIWHACVRGIDPGVEYGYRASGPEASASRVSRFDPSNVLIDPYSRALSGGETWGGDVTSRRAPWIRRSQVVDAPFDWKYDQPINRHLADSVIYELHARGFTRHRSSRTRHPGTFKGLAEKIPYLKSLGITAVELMPVTDFLESANPLIDPTTGKRLLNFWGYHPISFFALKSSYASDSTRGNEILEFKSMVRAFHEAGLEIILDMVYNHTGEGDDRGAAISFRGLDDAVYYMIDAQNGRYLNFSGCGNTLNCNHPVVRDLILDSLRYWVTEMHVDGFRFDLASILGRGTDGSVLANPPLLERIASDPVLANIKLIAEAWDAAGLYQVGSFPSWGRWAEWNGRFRDDVRQFWKGDPDKVRAFATRFCGSDDLYSDDGREPYHSVNFVTSHDGFTLADLVSYNQKHNEANGEQNRDGLNENDSLNFDTEGPSSNPRIVRQRLQAMKNLTATLLLSQGVPMMLAGDEIGRTQRGNNNAWCQDNEVSWVDWTLAEAHKDLLRFNTELLKFRRNHLLFRQRKFIGQNHGSVPRIVWHGIHRNEPDWSPQSHSIALEIQCEGQDADLYMVFNSYSEALRFELPAAAQGRQWERLLDTALDAPADIVDRELTAGIEDQRLYMVNARSTLVLLQR